MGAPVSEALQIRDMGEVVTRLFEAEFDPALGAIRTQEIARPEPSFPDGRCQPLNPSFT